eukprot:GHVR01168453.1.p1 GENE.GHVR01168453.1~~GHVR01168453.1.p1  ORF type:complete len:360 (-),score=54.18 GHVR01168453.1:471-1550(-)
MDDIKEVIDQSISRAATSALEGPKGIKYSKGNKNSELDSEQVQIKDTMSINIGSMVADYLMQSIQAKITTPLTNYSVTALADKALERYKELALYSETIAQKYKNIPNDKSGLIISAVSAGDEIEEDRLDLDKDSEVSNMLKGMMKESQEEPKPVPIYDVSNNTPKIVKPKITAAYVFNELFGVQSAQANPDILTGYYIAKMLKRQERKLIFNINKSPYADFYQDTNKYTNPYSSMNIIELTSMVLNSPIFPSNIPSRSPFLDNNTNIGAAIYANNLDLGLELQNLANIKADYPHINPHVHKYFLDIQNQLKDIQKQVELSGHTTPEQYLQGKQLAQDYYDLMSLHGDQYGNNAKECKSF